MAALGAPELIASSLLIPSYPQPTKGGGGNPPRHSTRRPQNRQVPRSRRILDRLGWTRMRLFVPVCVCVCVCVCVWENTTNHEPEAEIRRQQRAGIGRNQKVDATMVLRHPLAPQHERHRPSFHSLSLSPSSTKRHRLINVIHFVIVIIAVVRFSVRLHERLYGRLPSWLPLWHGSGLDSRLHQRLCYSTARTGSELTSILAPYDLFKSTFQQLCFNRVSFLCSSIVHQRIVDNTDCQSADLRMASGLIVMLRGRTVLNVVDAPDYIVSVRYGCSADWKGDETWAISSAHCRDWWDCPPPDTTGQLGELFLPLSMSGESQLKWRSIGPFSSVVNQRTQPGQISSSVICSSEHNGDFFK